MICKIQHCATLVAYGSFCFDHWREYCNFSGNINDFIAFTSLMNSQLPCYCGLNKKQFFKTCKLDKCIKANKYCNLSKCDHDRSEWHILCAYHAKQYYDSNFYALEVFAQSVYTPGDICYCGQPKSKKYKQCNNRHKYTPTICVHSDCNNKVYKISDVCEEHYNRRLTKL